MMRLCFGTLGKVLKLCKLENVSDVKLIGTLTRTVDPDCEYINSDGTAVSKLLSCTQNLSNGQKRRVGQTRDGETFEQGEETNRLSDIVSMARTADVKEVAAKIEKSVLPLLNRDRQSWIVPVLLEMISEDDSIEKDRQLTFEKYTGAAKEDFLKIRSACLPLFLAQLLLYSAAALKNREGELYVRKLTPEYMTGARYKFRDVSVSFSLKEESTVSDASSVPGLPALPDRKISAYLAQGTEKMSKIKTLLYGDQPVSFYSFYVCNDIWQRCTDRDEFSGETHIYYKTVRDATVKDLMNISRFLVITGTGGLGKSMMMRHLFLNAAAEYRSLPAPLVPVFIPVRNFGEKIRDLKEYVFSRLEIFGTGFTPDELDTLLRDGRCLLLFDGLDEISEENVSRFETELERLTDLFPKNMYVISSRPYQSFVSFSRFTVLQLQPFELWQARTLVEKLQFRPDIPEIKEKFLNLLETSLFSSHRDFAQNPLLLTIMLMTFERYAEVPSKMHIFYHEAFLTLAKEHDASKGAYKRKLKTGLSVDALESYFAEFCARTYHMEKFDFSSEEFSSVFYQLSERAKRNDDKSEADAFLYDLCSNLCLLYFEGGKYHFSHRSFQEYFCALYFSRRKDKDLFAIGEAFERRRNRNWNDKTFNMLYDMIPEKMEEYVFLPFIRELITKCRNGDGYWTFLETMYPEIWYSYDYAPSDHENTPVSFRYGFIREFFFPSSRIPEFKLPFYEEFIETKYYEILLPDGDTSVVAEDDVPDDYWGEHGEPDLMGYDLSFETAEVRKNPEGYEELLKLLEKDSFPLRREYDALLKYYDSLEARIIPRGEDLFDQFT